MPKLELKAKAGRLWGAEGPGVLVAWEKARRVSLERKLLVVQAARTAAEKRVVAIARPTRRGLS